ncbi:MAG: septum formation initiator family protein [Buchnera aphidicola (Nurudea shiraii)]
MLFFVQANFFLGDSGLYNYIILHEKILKKKSDILRLSRRNAKLLLEIKHCSTHSELEEEYVQSNLDMIKNNETFYRIIMDDKYHLNKID